jgi:sarcosine oxidase subunit alpha
VGGTLRLGRRRISVEDGDTVASALYRAGIRTFSRSLKYHRRRGLYCGTGECPNCLLTVDGVPGVRSCITPAEDGMRVRREGGWPSVERDALAVLDRLHVLLPVGFTYKTFIRPRWLWAMADRVIRRAVGLGSLPIRPVGSHTTRHLHCDVLVIGAGPAGRAAALSAAGGDDRVVLCDEGVLADPPATVEVLPRHAAIGVYEGPMVALAAPDGIVQVHPRRIVAATGGSEVHPVFPGNDLPGVMLGRAAAGLAERGVAAGRRAVMVAGHDEGIEHLAALRSAGVRIVAAVVPASLAARLPDDVRTLVGAEVLRADGKDRVRFAVVRDAEGVTRGLGCDLLVLSVGLWPRDDLVRMAGPGEVEAVGDAASGEAPVASLPPVGTVCLCEDVSVRDLERAWAEGYRSSELLKRYSTATMGPCQGAMCGRHLAGGGGGGGGAATSGGTAVTLPDTATR